MENQGRILIVDDEPKICQFVQVLLKREDYATRTAFNAADALEILGKEEFDILITDLKMPGIDGFELVQRAKELRPDMPIVMVTGYANVENAVKALRVGVEDYVTKPFNVDELRRVVSRILEARRMMAENRNLTELLSDVREQLARSEATLAATHEKASELAAKPGNGTPAPPAQEPPKPPPASLPLNDATVRNDLNRVLKRALETINTKLGAQASSIMIRTGDALEVRVCEGDRVRRLIGTRQAVGAGVAGNVAKEGRSLLVTGKEDRDLLPPSFADIYTTDSFLCAPILHEGRVLGVINVGEKADKAPFETKDLTRVEAVAARLAPIIYNAVTLFALQAQCRTVLEALMTGYETKVQYLKNHSQRVAEYAVALAQASDADADEIEVLRQAASLHDLGNLSLNDHLMQKEQPLSHAEQALIHEHPVLGERMIQGLAFLQPALPVVRHHHERVDGAGYPDGLNGESIPKLARMLAIADAFDAMTAGRPWHEAMTWQQAAGEITAQSGLQFDPDLAKIFCDRVIAPSN